MFHPEKTLRLRRRLIRLGCLIIAACMLFVRQTTVTFSSSMNIGSSIEIVRGPYLQYPLPSADTMGIIWETNLPAAGALLYGETPQKLTRISSNKNATRHKVILKNLDPAEAVHYRVEAGSRFTRHYSFRPFPAGEKNYKFIIYGDSRWNHLAHQAVVSEMKKYESRFIIHTGDMVTHGSSLNEWDNFFFVIRPLAARMPLFPVIGNHEYWKGGSPVYKSLFFPPKTSPDPKLFYYFDTANARFIVLDNRRIGKKKNEQKIWLEAVLKEARNEKKYSHIFVIVHQGIQSSGPHGPDKNLEKQGYIELMQSYDVTLVFGGHDHFYERGVSSDLRYLVTGGGGAPIYTKEKPKKDTQLRSSERHFIWFNIEGEDVQFKAVRPDGTLIEACSLKEKGFKCN